MIESIDSGIQSLVLAFCVGLSLHRCFRTRNKVWLLLTLFYSGSFLGSVYWLTYLLVVQKTPQFFYISDFSWLAAYLFLYLLLRSVSEEEEGYSNPKAAYLGPAFAGAMCIFYIVLHGDIFGNLMSMVAMSLLLWQTVRGLCFLKGKPDASARKGMYHLTLVFCLVEYGVWTASCFWMGDTLYNPYFWFDFMLTVSYGLYLPILGKVVRG